MPSEWAVALGKINYDKLQELRLRANQPLRVCYADKSYFLNAFGISSNYTEDCFTVNSAQIEKTVFEACERSVYAYNDQIINGYLTIEGGVRIGVCGVAVSEKGQVTSIRDYTSLAIRVPHFVENCSLRLADKICNPVCNCLIASPVGCGKTTFLRDIIFQLGKSNLFNLLLADSRNEVAMKGFPLLNCDVFSGCPKSYAFNCGIKSMSADVLFCDELSASDLSFLQECAASGVKLYATMHARDIDDLKFRLRGYDFFDRFVILSKSSGVGTVAGVYDGNFEELL